MLKLRHELLSALCLLPLLGADAVAATAGVTAAVNQNAKSIPPGGGVRTIVLGDNVVQDEKIETDGAGLVQILLADGTTFTVGPNSSLVIDRFVYDPDASTAEVAASLGRGVFRFIGGRTSKTEGGVTLNTPVGTVGIRGGMADLNFSGTGGNIAQIDLLFGNEITLNGPNGGDRLFQPGYSIIIGANGKPAVVKTPPGSANFIQQALAGRPGSTGGASQQPNDDDVEESGVDEANSGSTPPDPQDIPPPDLTAIDLATPKPNDNHQVAEEATPDGPKTLSGKYNGYSSAYVVRDDGDDLVGAFYRNVLPTDTEVDFNPTSRTFSGKISVSDGESGVLTVNFGGAGNSQYYNDYFYLGVGSPSGISVDGTPAAAGSTGGTYVFAADLGGLAPVCECSFIQLGYWASGVSNEDIGTVTGLGTFVTGTLSDDADYQAAKLAYGDASYDGLAVGYVTTLEGTEAAYGDMHMEFDFTEREGWMQISNFGSDDLSFGGGVLGNGAPTGSDPTFIGTSADQLGPEFQADGSFVNNGSTKGAGVIGNFSASDNGWSAGGVFGGTYSGPAPINP